MSAAVKAGRAQYSGDPGILGGIVGGVTGFLTGGPAGAVVGAVAGSGIGGGGAQANVALAKRVPMGEPPAWMRRATTRRIGPPATIPTTGGIRALPGQGKQGPLGMRTGMRFGAGGSVNPPFGGPPGVGFRLGGGIGEAQGYVETSPGEIAEVVQTVRRLRRYPREGGPPGPGYKLNKTGYFLRDGTWIAPESVWIKKRRRNSLNPKAMDRALSRIDSGKNAWKKMGRVTIRKKCK